MNLLTEQLESLLKSEKLKYVSRDGNLYEYSDLILNEDLNKDWMKNRSSFSAKKYWMKPNINPGSVFTAETYRDVWVRLNKSQLQAFGNEPEDVEPFDTLRIIMRKSDWRGKDKRDGTGILWEESWSDLVMDLTDEDWESAGTKILKEGLPDEKLYGLWENPPLGKTDEEILELLK